MHNRFNPPISAKKVGVQENIPDIFGDVNNLKHYKSTIRITAMNNLIELFRTQIFEKSPDMYKRSMAESIAMNIRDSDDKSAPACRLFCLTAMQKEFRFGNKCREPIEALIEVINDKNRPEQLRADAAQTLGLCLFLEVHETEIIHQVIDELANLWSIAETELQSSKVFRVALEAWIVVLYKADKKVFSKALADSQNLLIQFMESENLDFCISAAEAFGPLYQLAREWNPDFQFDHQKWLETRIEQVFQKVKLYNACKKNRGKLLFQQFNFSEETIPNFKLKFNKVETLKITDSLSRLLYNHLRAVLMDQFNTHLSTNVVLRNIFELGRIIKVSEDKENFEEKRRCKLIVAKTNKLHNIVRNERWKKKHW